MKSTLIIACGALAHELVAVKNANNWHHLEIQCLPASWHNTPEKITPAVAEKITELRGDYESIFVAYGDCGTGGQLDRLLQRENIKRLPGPHCYSFFAGEAVFDAMADEEMATFYLTDYLAANFERLIIDELGIAEHPELMPLYFGNYKRLLFLQQQENPQRLAQARAAANRLGLEFTVHKTGLNAFEQSLTTIRIATDG